MEAATDIDLATHDLGPLAWVLDELRKSLDAASAALRRFVRDAGLARGSDMASVDAGQLRIARQQLHQAVGALEMVGLPAPAQLLRSMEAAVQKFVERPELCSEAAASKVERAGFALTEYLEGVLLGKTTSAVALFPQYKDVQELAGSDRIHPADLWSYDWRWIEPETPAVAQALTYDAAVRRRMDQAVLRIVKSAEPAAARELAECCLALAASQAARQPKVFWKLCAGYFEALALSLLPADLYVKRAASRVLLQYATLAKGELGVSDRLAQDLLFFCAQAVPPQPLQAPALAGVRAAYGLGRFPPVDYATAQFGRFDPTLLAQARKRIALAKDTWSALSGGDANKLKAAAEQFHLIGESLAKLHPPSTPLAQALGACVDAVLKSGQPPRPEVAMEVATAVLYLEAAFQDLDPADAQLAQRTARLAERLDQVRQGEPAQALEPWMEELYRRVSDRQTMGSVVGELRATLGELEKLLDGFFRNPQDKEPLKNAPTHLLQMRGVLSVLALDHASQAVARMRESIEDILLGDPEQARAAGAFDKLGNNLGALGFLIDMLNYQPALAKKLFVYDAEAGELRPLMGRVGEPVASPEPEPQVVPQPVAQAAAAAAVTPAPQAPAAEIALPEPAVPQAAAPQPAAPPAAVPEAAAVPAGDEGDVELREIFLEEAREVVANGLAAIEALAAEPGNVSELTTLRRAFHTLKGSSRMVGLNDFGEAGWAMEQVLNTWLADQKPANDALRTLAREAMQGFGRWIEDIAARVDGGWKSAMFRGPADALRLEGRLLPIEGPAGGAAAADAGPGPDATPAVDATPGIDLAPAADAAPVADVAPAADVTLAFDLGPVAEAPSAPVGAPEATVAEAALPELTLPDFAAPAPVAQAQPEAAAEPLPDLAFTDAAPVPAQDAAAPAAPGLVVLDAAPETAPSPTPQVPDELAFIDLTGRASQPGALEPGAAASLDLPAFDLPTPEPAAAEAPASPAVGATAPDAALADLTFGDPSPAPAPVAAPAAEAPVDLSFLEPTPAAEPAPQAPADAMQAPPAFDLGDLDLAPPTAAEAAPPAEPEIAAIDFGSLAAVDGPAPPQEEHAVLETPPVELPTMELPGAEPHAPAPAEPAPAPEAAAPAEAAAAALDEQVKVIGDLRIGIPLYNVYLNEADEWSRRLATELEEWALELDQPVPEGAIGLAHALGGASATVGFQALSDVARALEAALQHAQPLGRGTPQHGKAFVDAAAEIHRLLHQFAAGFLKAPDARVLNALHALQDLDPAALPHPAGAGPSAQDAGEAPPDRPVSPVQDAATQPAAAAPTAPQAPAARLEGEDELDVEDAVDPDLFPIFEEEATELLPQLGSALREWAGGDGSSRDRVLRVLHTLKGSARLAGALRLGEMAHRMESEIEGIEPSAGATAVDALLQRYDGLQARFDALRAGSEQPEAAAAEAVAAQPATTQPAAAQPATGSQPAPAAGMPESAMTPPRVLARPAPAAVAPQRSSANQAVRVRAQLLDRLMSQAGEVMITRTRLENELRQLRASLADLTGNLDRLRAQLRDIELQAETQMQSRLAQAKDTAAGFDPLEFDRFTRVQELTRMMAESVNDVATVQRNLQRTVEATEDDLIAQARQTRELQRDLLRTRMVEFEGISDRLYRVVRLASKESGKQVKLDITGGSIEMDRGVLDRMTPAFEHLLRNCVAHGIEEPQVRQAAGKDATGSIQIELRQEGNDVSVEFRDDGAGLDLERIRRKAVESGLIAQDQQLSEGEAANLIFMPGFSTARQVTELAGRGIGMDVVRSEVNALGGRIETRTEPGRGTSFKLVLPLTTAVTQVVMVRTGDLTFGVPANLVEIVRRAPAREVQQAYNSGSYEYQGESMPFYWAGALLQSSARSTEPQGKTSPVVVFRSASQRMALHVDEILGNQEVVVKNLGPQLARLPGLAGMTVLASGAVVLIYNPVALSTVYGEQARLLSADRAQPEVLEQAGAPAGPEAAAVPQVPLVLVVDDSITVRRVTQRLLQREGYRVALAADGLQALEQLALERPVVVLSDIEMPRMDGFDLARGIRSDPLWSDLPIVMITSRIAEKHRQHARELGVNHYLGKPYSEEELLSLVRHYSGSTVSAA